MFGQRAFAYVNHGRWVADCPFRCGGADLVDSDIWLCRKCLNHVVDHRPIPLVWPTPEDIRAIEAALSVRPTDFEYAYWNWNLNESIGALVAENAMHGLFDPESGAVLGDIGTDHTRVPFLRAVAQLELTA